jgi:hypothetical protein
MPKIAQNRGFGENHAGFLTTLGLDAQYLGAGVSAFALEPLNAGE